MAALSLVSNEDIAAVRERVFDFVKFHVLAKWNCGT